MAKECKPTKHSRETSMCGPNLPEDSSAVFLKASGADPADFKDWIAEKEQWIRDINTETDEECRFHDLLMSTGRDNAYDLLATLKTHYFFVAPASVSYHDNYKGGLVRHSLKVYDEAMKLREEMIQENPDLELHLDQNSIIVAALLHDVCKCGEYRIDLNGNPIHYDVDIPYGGHGTKSVMMIQSWGFRLMPWELLAIRWHMGGAHLRDKKLKSAYEKAKKYPLVNLIVRADYNASHEG